MLSLMQFENKKVNYLWLFKFNQFRRNKLTLSLDENFVYLGSSLINFFTSFQELVSVTSPVSSSNSLKNK